MVERIIYIEKELKAIWKEYEPEYIVIEEMAVFRNAKSMRALIGLLYHLVIEFTKYEALVILVKPSEWRKGKIKGKCRADLKKESIEYVANKYKMSVNDDISDAILIAEYDVGIIN